MTPPTSRSSRRKVRCCNTYKSVSSAESVAVNPWTLELLVVLILSYTKAGKGPACPDLENKDLTFIPDCTEPTLQTMNHGHYSLIKGDKSSFSMSEHIPYTPTDTALA